MIPANINSLLLSAEAGAAPTAYQISRSLRFNSADGAYLSRTPTSAGNRKTFTFSCWAKRGTLGTEQVIFAARTGATSPWFRLLFRGSVSVNSLHIQGDTSLSLLTTAFFRDTAAWLHIVVAIDTTQATSSNRVKLYVNGTQLTSFGTATYPAQNADLAVNSTAAHNIGVELTNSIYFNGYLADIHLIDGQALTPGDFAETDATTGQWVAKAYSGTYGTNGFKLNFSDNSGTTSTTLGKDAAGSNNWTPNNFSVTAGAGNDSLVDSPTSYGTDTGTGGEVRGNYATLNPLDSSSSPKNGNLEVTPLTSGSRTSCGTIAVSTGKWYWEVLFVTNNNGVIGVVPAGYSATESTFGYNVTGAVSWYSANGNKVISGSGTSYASPYAPNDIIGVALNLDAGTITFYKNGVSQGVAQTGMSGTFKPIVCGANASETQEFVCNFGQRPFAYTAPSGFKALVDTNLGTPTIVKPSTVVDVTTYTGNGSTQTISGLGFSPDFVWIKGRSNAGTSNIFSDSLRGSGTYYLVSDLTSAEDTTNQQAVTALTSSGFTVGNNGGVNSSSYTYVAWTWDAGSSTASNTQGSITSSVRANASAGFSIVTYTGAGGTSTVGHGLGVAPALWIIKSRNLVNNWNVYHTSLGANKLLLLNLTNAVITDTNASSSVAPTSTAFTVKTTGANDWDNISGTTYVAYCFAPVAGYSAFGSYTGNGSGEGPFVHLGFRPAVVIVKISSSTGNWTILDYKREGYNVDNDPLFPNLNSAEGTTDLIDITSNGFKVRTTDATFNTNAGTYVYAAWAEYPFQYARAR